MFKGPIRFTFGFTKSTGQTKNLLVHGCKGEPTTDHLEFRKVWSSKYFAAVITVISSSLCIVSEVKTRSLRFDIKR